MYGLLGLRFILYIYKFKKIRLTVFINKLQLIESMISYVSNLAHRGVIHFKASIAQLVIV